MHFGDKMNKHVDSKWAYILLNFQVLAIIYKSSHFINKHIFLLWQVSFCVLDWSLNSFVCLQSNWWLIIKTKQTSSTHGSSLLPSHTVQTFLWVTQYFTTWIYFASFRVLPNNDHYVLSLLTNIIFSLSHLFKKGSAHYLKVSGDRQGKAPQCQKWDTPIIPSTWMGWFS